MNQSEKWLAALPVYGKSIRLQRLRKSSTTLMTFLLLMTDPLMERQMPAACHGVEVLTHQRNRGYGAALISAFRYAIDNHYDGIVTLDCDGQHQPKRIPEFIRAAAGSIWFQECYLQYFEDDSEPPPERYAINRQITEKINAQLGLKLTDAFCGFKAYRTEALRKMHITDPGYAMPLELWVQAAASRLQILEIPVPLIYLDLNRSFGGVLDEAETRLNYYREVLAISSVGNADMVFPTRGKNLPALLKISLRKITEWVTAILSTSSA